MTQAIARVILLTLLPLTALAVAGQDDITFIVAGKTSNHLQQAAGVGYTGDRSQQDPVDDAEDGGVGADADGDA